MSQSPIRILSEAGSDLCINLSPTEPEIKLVASGAAADVVGAGLDIISPADRDVVLQAFPRLGFKSEFVATCAEVARRHSASTKGTFMRDIGERKVTDFRPSNICDAIDHSPFSE
jgi:hypothetical protein